MVTLKDERLLMRNETDNYAGAVLTCLTLRRKIESKVEIGPI